MGRIKAIRRTPAVIGLSLIALLLAVGGTAQAKQEEPNKAGAKFYGPSDYRTPDDRVSFAHAGVGQLACTSSPHVDGPAGSIAVKLDVPDGASITKVTAYYYDTDPNEQLSFHVAFSEPGVTDLLDGFAEVASVDGTPDGPPGGAQSVELVPTAPVPVDNANRSYMLAAEFSACGTTAGGPEGEFPTLLLDGVRLEYTLK